MPTKTPLLRLLMCYLCGIWAGDALYFKEAPQITGIALAAVVACLLLFTSNDSPYSADGYGKANGM